MFLSCCQNNFVEPSDSGWASVFTDALRLGLGLRTAYWRNDD